MLSAKLTTSPSAWRSLKTTKSAPSSSHTQSCIETFHFIGNIRKITFDLFLITQPQAGLEAGVFRRRIQFQAAKRAAVTILSSWMWCLTCQDAIRLKLHETLISCGFSYGWCLLLDRDSSIPSIFYKTYRPYPDRIRECSNTACLWRCLGWRGDCDPAPSRIFLLCRSLKCHRPCSFWLVEDCTKMVKKIHFWLNFSRFTLHSCSN